MPEGGAAEDDKETVTAGEGMAVDFDLRPLRVVLAVEVDHPAFAVGLGVHQVLVQLDASATEEAEEVTEAPDDESVCDAVRKCLYKRDHSCVTHSTYHLANGREHCRSTRAMLSV